MAWYALYKWFIPWRRTGYINGSSWYRKYLYSEWFNALSEADKQKELNRIEELKQKRKRRGEQALKNFGMMLGHVNYATNGRMMDYMKIATEISKISTPGSKYW